MTNKPDELAQIARTLDTDPRATEVPHEYGVLLSAHHNTLLLELMGCLDKSADDILKEIVEAALENTWRVIVHEAVRGD